MITMEELERRINAVSSMTAAELDALLHSCPEWVERKENEDRASDAMAQEFDRDVAPLIADLRAIGFEVKEPDELKSLPNAYPAAFPVLLRHLEKDYSGRVREAIISALGVERASGEPIRAVLEQFRRSGDEERNIRFRMADTLQIAADRSMAEELEQLATKERDEGIAGILTMAAKSAMKRKAVD
ncbi:hypothetical protein ACRAQ7_14195 [Erythrobacter sp. W53]|uniref:hypothetical protein n=1 Tax=Erythrobacter sp. W53 TaxID=3425947 RepID=UPI003D76977E